MVVLDSAPKGNVLLPSNHISDYNYQLCFVGRLCCDPLAAAADAPLKFVSELVSF